MVSIGAISMYRALTMLPKDQWVNYAIHKYLNTFHGSKTCVFGSMEPWVEAASLYAGAEEVLLFQNQHSIVQLLIKIGSDD